MPRVQYPLSVKPMGIALGSFSPSDMDFRLEGLPVLYNNLPVPRLGFVVLDSQLLLTMLSQIGFGCVFIRSSIVPLELYFLYRGMRIDVALLPTIFFINCTYDCTEFLLAGRFTQPTMNPCIPLSTSIPFSRLHLAEMIPTLENCFIMVSLGL